MKNSSKGTYYRDLNFDMHAIDTSQVQVEAEVYLAKLIKGDTYACPILVKSEMPTKNEPAKEENKKGVENSRATIESKVARQNALKDREEEDTEALKEEPLKGEYVGKSKFEHRKNDEDNDDAGRLITIQFGSMPSVMANKYLLANEFKNKEHDEEITEENKEAACTLECGEGMSAKIQFTHDNDREEDDEMTDIEEEIDLEVGRRVRRVLYNNLLGQIYQ
ncbi:hypothetical protein Adt_33586 [Abeliophyllum distichum]|uniref:Uncharacterized protein n=1 Tax=Abeliophyllum distichum TaxID=126358 RepID=A0ABD1QWN2_9LAMI